MKLGRLLTVEECDWLNVRAFEQGYDLDTCSPQLVHIVLPSVEAVERQTLCSSPNLWFTERGWNVPSAKGNVRSRSRQVTCADCLQHFAILYTASQQKALNPSVSTFPFESLSVLKEAARCAGRHDLNMVFEAAGAALLCETPMSEDVLTYILSAILSHKVSKTSRALDLLWEADHH